ncbi:MAG TPA: hypothetical protein DCM86_14015 [Verrucomicrobiales bacterium]|nr:hypothetical protein [Verrucomicrobiales bacterium]
MSLLPRRRFLRRFGLGLAVSALPGRRWRETILWEAAAATPDAPAVVTLSLADFPALGSDLGSVRLTVNPVGPDHFPRGNIYPFLVNRVSEGVFRAMSAECRHAGCVVESYDELSEGIRCPCHGSVYDITGQRIVGPAPDGSSLGPLPLIYDGIGSLQVTIPGLAFRIAPSRVDLGGGGGRLRLQFPTLPWVTYEVHFRERVSDPGLPVPFSSSPEGPPDQWTVTGDELPATVYVAPPGGSGFFEISMLLLEE